VGPWLTSPTPAPESSLSAEQIQTMFERVASRYDLANRVMTLGMDRRWRRLIQRCASLRPGERLLDIATGTGQLAFDARRCAPLADVVATDLTSEMLDIARRRPGASTIAWSQMDARCLGFPDASFDVITHGYLLRYLVEDVTGALREQLRVLKPGGRLVALESSPGQAGILGRAAARVTHHWPRLVGRILARNAADYRFLQDSTLAFMQPEDVIRHLQEAGFSRCSSRSYLHGMLTVYWATKPGPVGRPNRAAALSSHAGRHIEGAS
jgi:demethylmenaquinone methyltransferase/2-methoxy-6-polyprenyl-1,4-benzoquinol methylase